MGKVKYSDINVRTCNVTEQKLIFIFKFNLIFKQLQIYRKLTRRIKGISEYPSPTFPKCQHFTTFALAFYIYKHILVSKSLKVVDMP